MVMPDQIPVYAPTSGVIFTRSHRVWLEAELGVHRVENVEPIVITGQRIQAGAYIGYGATLSIHWEYEARMRCQYCRAEHRLAQVDVYGGTTAGRAMSEGWRLCQRCFGKLLSQWRARWLAEGSPRDWTVGIYSHISRRPIGDLQFKGEGGLRVV